MIRIHHGVTESTEKEKDENRQDAKTPKAVCCLKSYLPSQDETLATDQEMKHAK